MSALLLVFLGAKGFSWEELPSFCGSRNKAAEESRVDSSMMLFLKTCASLRDKLRLAPASLRSAALPQVRKSGGCCGVVQRGGLQSALPMLLATAVVCTTSLGDSYGNPTNPEPAWHSPGGDGDCSVEGKRNYFLLGRVLGKNSLKSCCRKQGCVPAGSLYPVQLCCK